MKIRSVLVAIVFCLFTSLTHAAQIQPFDQQTFNTLTEQGKPLIVEITASWCPTCKRQKPIIKQLSQQPEFNDLTILSLDFDQDVAARKQLKVNKQSTLIVFKDGQEVTRSTGETRHQKLNELFQKAIN